MAIIRPVFASKNFKSGLNIVINLFDNNNNLMLQSLAQEWANTGCYFIQTTVSFAANKTYLAIAEDINSDWKAAKFIKQSDAL